MSYLAYFNNYHIRQVEAQYLSMLYEILGKKFPAYFILNEDYIKDYSESNRWEIQWVRSNWGPYEEVYKELTPDKYILMQKPEKLIKEDKGINSQVLAPSEVLRYTYENEVPTQVQSIKEGIRRIKEKGELQAGITWVNNKCFKKVMESEGVPVIHHEMGPLRSPIYVSMIYWDYSGVNGNTEFDKRFEKFLKVYHKVPLLDRKELLRVVSPQYYRYLCGILENKDREYDIGVGLQVECDTNLLLFNNGAHWIDPILAAKRDSETDVLVRPHPLAGFTVKETDRIKLDNGRYTGAPNFINKCNKIYCLNSSIGFEALLLGRESVIFGDSPFRSLCFMDEPTLIKALNFTIFGYLIHRDLLFNEDYYKFRLNTDDEVEIYKYNMKRLLEKAKAWQK